MRYADLYNNPQLLKKLTKKEINNIARENEMEDDKYTILLELRECARNFAYFLNNYVYTIDNNDPTTKYKKFPNLEWPAELARIIEQHAITYIVKSRQIMGTWFAVAYAVWKCIFGHNVNVYMQSYNREVSEELIARAKVIVDMLPDFMIETLDGSKKCRYTKDRIEFQKMGSTLAALPSNPYALRSLTAGLVIIDEASIHRQLEETYTAAVPMCQKIIVMGTPAAGTDWYHMYFPTENAKRTQYRNKFKEITRGLYIYSDEKRNIARVKLHYTSDPNKQVGSKWYNEKKNSMTTTQFKQEFELEWVNDDANDIRIEVTDETFAYNYYDVVDDLINGRATLYMSFDPGIKTGALVWFAVYPKEKDDLYYPHVIVYTAEINNLNIDQKVELINGVERELGATAYSRTAGHDINMRSRVSGLTMQQEWAKRGIYFNYVTCRITDGLQQINNMLYNGYLGVAERTNITKNALYSYSYNPKTKKRNERSSHIIDAIRYGIASNWIYVRTSPYKQIHNLDIIVEFNSTPAILTGGTPKTTHYNYSHFVRKRSLLSDLYGRRYE